MKKFYGGKFLDKIKLEKEGIKYPIKLEYYKKIEENEKGNPYFGISIVKTEYKKNNIYIETKEVENICDDEKKIEKLLSIFKEFEVTPISAEYIIKDLMSQYKNPKIQKFI